MFCWLLGSLPSRTAERALVAVLSGPRSSLWLEAANSLIKIGTPPSAAALVRLMLMGHDRRRRVACAYALGWIDAGPHLAEVVRALTSVVAGSDDSDVRSHAAESLGNRLRFGRVAGRRAAERVLIDGLRDEHSDVRFWCAVRVGSDEIARGDCTAARTDWRQGRRAAPVAGRPRGPGCVDHDSGRNAP